MPYICKDCNNKTSFSRIAYGSCNYNETHFLDECGDVLDYGDTEYDNYDQSDEDGIECTNCGSTNVEDVSEIEWENWNGPIDENEKRSDETWLQFMERRSKVD